MKAKASEVLNKYEKGERHFEGVDLSGQSFQGKNLSGANFSGAIIRGTNFSGATLQGTKFCGAKAGLPKFKSIFSVICSALIYTSPSYFTFVLFKIPTIPETIINHPIEFNIFIIGFNCLFICFLWLGIKNGFFSTLLGLVLIGLLIVASTISGYGLSFPIAEFYFIVNIILFFVAIPVAIATFIIISNFGIKGFLGLLSIFITFKLTQNTSLDSNIFLSIWILISGYFSGTILGLVISNNYKKNRWIHTINIYFTTLFCQGTTFYNADLTGADFTGANLPNTNLRTDKLIRTCFLGSTKLNLALLNNTILANPTVRDLLTTGIGEGKSYIGANLKGANLKDAKLKKANLRLTDLSEATLENANLEEANLTQVNAIGTNFNKAIITAACIEDWKINNSTMLNNVNCDYIYLFEKPKPGEVYSERCPSSGTFSNGEFTKIFKEVLDTVTLIFRNGVDWKAFLTALKKVQVVNEDIELNIQLVENKSDVLIIKVQVPLDTDKEKIHRELIQEYELKLKAKNDEICQIYRQSYSDIMKMAKVAAIKQSIDIHNHNEVVMNNSNDESRNFTMGNVGGDFKPVGSPIQADNATISGTIADTINQLPSSSNPEQPGIKELLEKLKTAINDPTLSNDDKQLSSKQLQSLAEAAENPKDGEMQKKAKKAISFLKAISDGLEPATKLVTASKDIIPAIAAFFGL